MTKASAFPLGTQAPLPLREECILLSYFSEFSASAMFLDFFWASLLLLVTVICLYAAARSDHDKEDYCFD